VLEEELKPLNYAIGQIAAGNPNGLKAEEVQLIAAKK
jgi:hypothetical protein